MILTIANISTQIKAADLKTAVDAIGRQVTEHFQPEWGITANLNATPASIKNRNVKIQGKHDAIIYLGDSSQDPTTGVKGALGYHSTNYGTIPYGFVYLDICAEYQESWTCTLSHEVLELLADPDAAMTVTGPAPKGAAGNVYYDLEVCDPTQGDSYSINDVKVSNFVGRNYFGLTGGSGKSNYLDLALDPFGVRPGGYFQYEDGSGAHQIQGKNVTQRQLAAKRLMEAGRRNERRNQRINHGMLSTQLGGKMSTQHASPSLRVALATNPDLRRKIHQSMATAALNTLKEAGVKVTAADIADAQADIAALTVPAGAIKTDATGAVKMDTVGDVASVATSVATIVGLTGF
jgi:hypothetical protein